jgi:hypothetical protein
MVQGQDPYFIGPPIRPDNSECDGFQPFVTMEPGLIQGEFHRRVSAVQQGVELSGKVLGEPY